MAPGPPSETWCHELIKNFVIWGNELLLWFPYMTLLSHGVTWCTLERHSPMSASHQSKCWCDPRGNHSLTISCVSCCSWIYLLHQMPLPADPEEKRVAMARRGLPGQTRTTSSWHCKQMTWFSWFSPTLLQPLCSPPAWIFIPVLIWRTSRMSAAPASCSSILLSPATLTVITHGFGVWMLQHEPSPSFQHPLLHPRHTDAAPYAGSTPLHRVSVSRLLRLTGFAVFTHDSRRGCFTWAERSQC